MFHKKVPHNAPWPCVSGRQYEARCWDKGFEWVEDEAGTVYKSTSLSPEVQEALEQLRQEFIAKHGRQPGPDERMPAKFWPQQSGSYSQLLSQQA